MRYAKARTYLVHQEVLLHALLGQVPQLLHGLIHALAGAQLFHRAQRVPQQHQGHPEDDLDACRPEEKRPWMISLGVSAWPVHGVLTAPIPVYC